MKLKDVFPFVRLAICSTLTQTSSDTFRLVQTRDCRIFFITSGQGSIVIEKKEYHISRGCLIYIRAGEHYIIKPDSHISMVIINFDYTENFSSVRHSFHPFSENFPGVLEDILIEDAAVLSKSAILYDADRFESPLKSIVSEFPIDSPLRDEFLSSVMKYVLIDFVRSVEKFSNDIMKSQRLVSNIIDFLKENYPLHIENETIAEHFHYSSVYINRIFKKEIGISLHKYVIRIRIDMACRLLSSKNYSPTETAIMVGFDDYPHFSKTFKLLTGMSPQEFQENKLIVRK